MYTTLFICTILFICTLYSNRQVNNEAISPHEAGEAVRVDSVTGYFCDCDIFVGRPTGGTQTEEGLGERVVLQLTECLTGKNYQIFADNYFTTTHLLDTLQSRRLYGCGTTRSTRCGFPKRR